MKGWFAKVSRNGRVGLIPTDEHSLSLLNKMGDGECAEFSIVRARSVPMHRRYFGICRRIGENQDPRRDENSIDMELRVLAGHYDVIRMHNPNRGAERPWLDALVRFLRGFGLAHLDWIDGLMRLRDEAEADLEVRIPKRIAFDKLTHDEWMELYPSLEQAGIERFGAEYFLQDMAA